MAGNCWNSPITLTWRESEQSSKEFTLYAGGAEAARVVRLGWGGDDADVTTQLGSWRIRSEGFWKRKLIITDGSTGRWIGECGMSWTASERTIRMHDGTHYVWRQAGWWADKFELSGPAGRVILVTQAGSEEWKLRDLFRTNGWTEIKAAEPDPATLSLLGGLSWLFLLIHREQMSSTVVLG